MTLTLLLVDDDPLMHRMLVPRLRELPLRPHVVSAQTPQTALDELDRLPQGPLVVLSDFNLKAAMNGLQLLHVVRERRPEALRVLFSGYSIEQLGDMQEGGDADAFLEKPLVLDDLVRPLAELLQGRFPDGMRGAA